MRTRYVKGQWNACCDRCGIKYKSGQMKKEWTGLMVCHGPGTADCWEPRHPQDRVRGVPDRQAPPWSRPMPTPVYVTPEVLSVLLLETGDKILLETGDDILLEY